MANAEDNRADELKALGWSAEDLRRYEELWEYRQRWGAINLEREDRIFLRQAEAALPKRAASGRGTARKTIQEKSHYRWLASFLEAMRTSPVETGLPAGEVGAWPLILEAELQALNELKPVLGLPDSLKAKVLIPERERWAREAAAEGRSLSFDFASALEQARQSGQASWKPLRGEGNSAASDYPVLPAAAAAAFRARVLEEVSDQMRRSFPSLQESAKEAAPASAAEAITQAGSGL
ncbi:MAG: hypothetical protein R6W06_02905 [Prochlorococcaceae cyanobacterium]